MTDLSRGKGNWAIKFGQFMEYNAKHIFLGKPSRKCEGEIIPRPFFQNMKTDHISELSCTPFAFTSYKAYLKNKKSGTSPPASVSA